MRAFAALVVLGCSVGWSVACSSGEVAAPQASTSVSATIASAPTPSASSPPAAAVSSTPVAPTPPDEAQRKRLEADVASVAIERHPGSPGWESTKTLLMDRLTKLGYKPQLESFSGGVNILAERKGSTNAPRVILSAHYDHIRGCRGADDNASGVAVVLEAARQLQELSPLRTLTLAFWDREEDGLLGSMFHANEARKRGEEILIAISLDSIGFASSAPNSQTLPSALQALLPDVYARAKANDFRADFITALGDVDAGPSLTEFESFGAAIKQPAFGVPLPGLARLALADAARSDHASFWLNGYSGVMVTDTANFRNPRYHCGGGPDDPNTLDYAFLNRVASVVIATARAAVFRP